MPRETLEDLVYRYVLDEANVAFLRFNLEAQVVAVNQFTEHLLGPGVAGRSFSELFVDFGGTLRFEELIADSQRVHSLDVTTHTGIPQTFYFRFFDLGSEVLALGRTNALEEERLRSEVLALNQELANLNRQLHQGMAELKRLNEQKSQFVGMAAHDLRSPLSTITMAAQCLAMQAGETLDDVSRNLLARIEAICESTRRLVDAFLDLSVVESGRLQLQRKPTDIRALIDRAKSLLEIPARKKQVAIAVDHGPDVPASLMVDGPRVEQVVVNFLSNAVEYTRPGSTVVLATRRDGTDLKISVTDQGEGISPQAIPRLFRPFERGTASKAGGEPSTGLGLVIARKVVEAHGGAVSVESELGKGATFSFRIPLGQPPGEEEVR